MTFDSIILDIDGTLWDSRSVVADSWNHVIATRHAPIPHLTAERLAQVFGKPMNVIADTLFAPLRAEQRYELLDACCADENPRLASYPGTLLYPGVKQTITVLAEKYPLYIVSNCQSGYIEALIAQAGLAPYIQAFRCYGDNGLIKAENIKLLVKECGLKTPVYVGDTQGDCDACCDAGVPFIWAAYGFGTAGSYAAKIDSFSELLHLAGCKSL